MDAFATNIPPFKHASIVFVVVLSHAKIVCDVTNILCKTFLFILKDRLSLSTYQCSVYVNIYIYIYICM